MLSNVKTPNRSPRTLRRRLTCAIATATLLLTTGGVALAADPSDLPWAQWRGPLSTGEAAAGAKPPAEWSEQKNVKWKVKIPGRGESTPIVVGDKVFLQTALQTGDAKTAAAANATPDGAATVQFAQDRPRRPGGGGGGGRGEAPATAFQFTLLCLDRKTGQTLWQKVLKQEVPHEGHHKDHGYSSYSPVSDGKLVWAYFGSRGLHCLDLDGNVKWSKDLGKMQTRNGFGEGSSPALHGDVIVVNWDHEGPDFIAAFDKTTGNELWRNPRDENTTWSTPLVVEHDGKAQVIVSATGKIRSYDLKTGKELWTCGGMTTNAIPSPVTDGETVYATSGFRGSALLAIKLDNPGGELTGSGAIAWSLAKATPYVPSPLLYNGRLYYFRENNGILSCVDAKTGKVLIDGQRIDDLQGVYASPVAANGHVYLLSRTGNTVVFQDGAQPKELRTNTLEDQFHASPAIAGNEIFLRGFQSLYCIAEKD